MKKIDLIEQRIDLNVVEMLGHFYCEKYCVMPIKIINERLHIAVSKLNQSILTNIMDITGYFLEPLLAEEQDILYHINLIFGQEQRNTIAKQYVKDIIINHQIKEHINDEILKEAPAVRFVDSLIETGVLNRASDIHIEPYEKSLRARYRIDGRLITLTQVDLSILPNAISRLKVMGGMDISEKRLPQDGHFTMRIHGEEIDFRISTLPTFYGEKASIRLLYDQTSLFKKDKLGFFSEDLPFLNRLFNQPYGAVFMTGPTGSGKSTTLNSFLEEINTEQVNIVTVEDPVENPLTGVNHMPVEPAAGLTFANALRSILRQDPDIIIIGEIRDSETARIAIQAAITGHLVLSTLHTNDAAGVVERLADMGVEPYLIAAALNGIISQRLVRKICPFCKIKTELTEEEVSLLRLESDTVVYTGKGCVKCGGTGYKGRLAVYEYIIMDETLRREMSKNSNEFSIRLRGRKTGSLRYNAFRNLELGNTDAKEIVRVLNRDIS